MMKAILKTLFSCTLLGYTLAGVINNSETKLRLAARAEVVKPHECPYYASIQITGHHDCGGAIISKNHILTAAHCVQPIVETGILTDQLLVEVGTMRIGQGEIHKVKRVSYYKNYEPIDPFTPYLQPNDVAVITLESPVTQSEDVKIISLPPASFEVPNGAKVKISGFGSTRMGAPTSPVLHKSELSIVSFSECNEYFNEHIHRNILPSAQICAKGDVGYGVCEGDSGGPLVYDGQVVGLVSGGDGRCGSGNPDIFTKVSTFISYIQSELNGGDASQSIALDKQSQYFPGAILGPGVDNQFNPPESQYPPSETQYYPQENPLVSNPVEILPI